VGALLEVVQEVLDILEEGGEKLTIDDLISAARLQSDFKKQIELWKEAQIKILQYAAAYPFIDLGYLFARKSSMPTSRTSSGSTSACAASKTSSSASSLPITITKPRSGAPRSRSSTRTSTCRQHGPVGL
jgi:hypothetical protein